jgi:hypothetical protein
MTFKLKNYTTGICWDKTVLEIERMLVEFGATGIMKEYGEFGVVNALSFKIPVNDRPLAYRLPCNYENAQATMKAQGLLPKKDLDAARVQAANTTWRIIKDWLHAQLSLVAIGQAKPQEVFLPYMSNGRTTLFQMMEKRGFNLPQLEGGASNE